MRRLTAIPPIKALMTPFPQCVQLDSDIGRAERMMGEHGIRHLPVMSADRLVGVLNRRDLQRASEQVNASKDRMLVSDLPLLEPYIVDLSAPADAVLAQMAARHLDAVLVVKDGRLAGIFTMTDAFGWFVEVLRSRFPPPGGDEAS